jgi:transposase
MFEYFQGAPNVLVSDNLKAGVAKAHIYDPDINPTYQDLANHYGVAIVPSRIAAPKDKAKVEVGVQGIERRIIAPVRHHTFFSIAEINAAIAPLLKTYNEQPFQQLPGCRLSQFLALDKPALRPLPTEKYVFAQWKKVRVNMDYHFIFEKRCYSVPYVYLRKEMDLRITSLMVECFYRGKPIAMHVRHYQPGYTTVKEHMPRAHQEYAQWTPQRLMQWAAKIGPATQQLIQQVIAARPFPQQAYRACLGILRLGKKYSEHRLECAAQRALSIGAIRYQSIESILKYGLDQQPLPDLNSTAALTPTGHDNIRGAFYYQ